MLTSRPTSAGLDDLVRLEAAVRDRFGGADVLMNNAGIGPGSGVFGPPDAWKKTLATNLWGVIHGTQVFVPGMIARGRPGLVVNTGSKQGITTPPGNPAYNVSKAGVKVFTEALAHELRGAEGCAISAHLLIPGFVFTGLTGGRPPREAAGRLDPGRDGGLHAREHRAAATSTSSARTTTCPAPLDEKRILWAAGDIVENRPPLSRWHPAYADAFADFIKDI